MIKTVEPLNVSPAIKAARWTFLFLGIMYAVRKRSIFKEYERTAHVIREQEIKDKYARLAVEAKLKSIEEVASLAKDFEITDLPPGWEKDL